MYGSNPPSFCVWKLVVNMSLKNDLIPISEITSKLSCCPDPLNFNTTFLFESVKYLSKP